MREVEERLQVTRANVRYYEKERLLFPKRNRLNDYREYSGEDLKTLERILQALLFGSLAAAAVFRAASVLRRELLLRW